MNLSGKLIVGFIAISLLVGLVGFLGLYANNQIVNSLESGKEHFGPIIEASTELSSYAKRAEGHVMLFLMLHNETDRQKFFKRITSLREQNSIIEEKVVNPEARAILENIKSKTDELQSAGESLFKAYNNETKTKGRFEFENHQELIRKLNNVASDIREDGLELAKVELGLQTELERTAKKNAAFFYDIILIIGIVAVLSALALGYVIDRNIANPIKELKEAAVDLGKGNFGTKIEIKSKDEIGELAGAFNKMALNLQKSNDKIISAKEYTDNIVRSMSDTLIVVSPDGIIQTVNSAACTLLGYTEKELIGQPVGKLLEDELLFKGPEHDYFIKKGFIQNVEKTYLSKDSRKIPVVYSASVMHDKDGRIQGIVCVAQDITERKRAEEKIQEQAALLDKAQDAIIVHDLEHHIIYWNKSAQHLYGFSAEEAMGKSASELLYKEEPPQLISAKMRVIERGEWIGELRQITKDGKEIIVESRWTLIRDNKGEPKSILVINTDITERKKLEVQFFRAQRMESIGILAGGIAHDINNVLTPIMLSLELLREKFKDERSQRLLNIVERSTQRGANLVKQVMSFARGIEGERVALQVTHIITEIERIAKETFPRSIEIRTYIEKDLFTISGDATQLHQVLMNLCVNARDAMLNGGILSIYTENFLVDENYARMNIEAKVGPYIVISVSDTGTGIPPGILNKIFEPFFTTKEHGKGTGLGLSTVHAIVKSHGGFIEVSSEIGKGTTFKIYLPATKTETQKVEEQQSELPSGQGEIILVVDDEAPIRDITTEMLKTNGYRVITACDGAEAVALYAQHKEVIEVVLLDMMMPVMDGQVSIRALRKVNPEVRIIAVSGLTEKDQLAKVADTHVHAFLTKPYIAKKLLKTIREVLGMK